MNTTSPEKWVIEFDKILHYHEKHEDGYVTTYVERKAALELVSNLIRDERAIVNFYRDEFKSIQKSVKSIVGTLMVINFILAFVVIVLSVSIFL